MSKFDYDAAVDLHPVLRNMDVLLKTGRLKDDSLLMEMNGRMVEEAYGAKCSWSRFPALRMWSESMAFLGGTRALKFARGRGGYGTGSLRYSNRKYGLELVNLAGTFSAMMYSDSVVDIEESLW